MPTCSAINIEKKNTDIDLGEIKVEMNWNEQLILLDRQ